LLVLLSVGLGLLVLSYHRQDEQVFLSKAAQLKALETRTQFFTLIPDNALALANRHFNSALRELAQGGLSRARSELERAISLAELACHPPSGQSAEPLACHNLRRYHEAYLELLEERFKPNPNQAEPIISLAEHRPPAKKYSLP
jgi:hypothetical protein